MEDYLYNLSGYLNVVCSYFVLIVGSDFLYYIWLIIKYKILKNI